MHAFYAPWWLYVLFVASAALLLGGSAAASVVIHLGERLNWKGYAVIAAMLVLGVCGCAFFGGLIWVVGGVT